MKNLFHKNKYTKWYMLLTDYRKEFPCQNNYTEKHHIIPKSIGGSNKKDNIAVLSVREHIFCHKLLSKIVIDSKHKSKMLYALMRMYYGNKEQVKLSSKFTARLVEQIKENCAKQVSLRMTGRKVLQSTRDKLSKAHKGKTLSKETKEKISKRRIGVSTPKPDYFGALISEKLKGRKRSIEVVNKVNKNPEKIRKTAEKHRGMKRTDISKKKMSIARKEFIIKNGGAPSKGMKMYFNPADTSQRGQYFPNTEPSGWILGNPARKGRMPYKCIKTGQIKWFLKGTINDGWRIWNPNKRY